MIRSFLKLWWLTAALLAGAQTASADDAVAPTDATAPVILVMGDSLSAAYGIPLSEGWVALLQRRLQDAGYPHTVVNASVSGETTSGGLRRLPALLDRHQPQMVLIELGANDGLRGQPLEALRTNLRTMVDAAKAAGAQPVLFEMRIPPNYGMDYADGFQASFNEVGADTGTPVIPFFLMAIALNPAAFQDDGIHPTVEVQDTLLDAVWPTLAPLLPPN